MQKAINLLDILPNWGPQSSLRKGIMLCNRHIILPAVILLLMGLGLVLSIFAAHDLLAATYARFTEGFGTSDLIRARGLMADLEANKPSLLARPAFTAPRPSGARAKLRGWPNGQ